MKRRINSKDKKTRANLLKINNIAVSQVRKKLTTYLHKYQHYCFECECHPDDDVKELEEKMQKLHR